MKQGIEKRMQHLSTNETSKDEWWKIETHQSDSSIQDNKRYQEIKNRVLHQECTLREMGTFDVQSYSFSFCFFCFIHRHKYTSLVTYPPTEMDTQLSYVTRYDCVLTGYLRSIRPLICANVLLSYVDILTIIIILFKPNITKPIQLDSYLRCLSSALH